MPEQTPTGKPGATRRRRILVVVLSTFLITAVAVAVFFASRAENLAERRLRAATIELLENRFDSEVELGHVELQLRPALRVRYEGLVLRHRGRRDIPPVIAIRSLTLEGTMMELWNRRVDRVHLDGLAIVIPPRRGEDLPKLVKKDEPAPAPVAARTDERPDVLIRELVSENARLSIMPKRDDKPPREFLLHAIRLEGLQFAEPTPFQASLTNPIPEGRIEAVGTFGPWESEEPSLTPVTGTFTFDADLGTIKGIGGQLDSEGSFAGPLERIDASGHTETPDFRITATKGHPVRLATTFDATVDGTNGDVILEQIEAKIVQSLFLVKGPVVGVKGMKGRHIMLHVTTSTARLEDVLTLVLKGSTPPIVGKLGVQAKLDLPPKGADLDVMERMTLDGQFTIDDARFTSEQVQEKIDELARRGAGRPKDAAIDNVLSDMRGRLHMADGRIRLTGLTFTVQGTTINMNGVYNVRSEALDFRGVVLLKARASQAMTGFTSLLLKPFDPLLRKQGAGTRLAIKVTGTRDKPEFGLDLGRTFKGQ
ncbi:MAG: hypothetical protein ABR606_19055 [Vicinamibacterales bacterium]